MKNLIFYFSGTGNSLKLAEDISKELEESVIISMGVNKTYKFSEKFGEYETIGFAYPSYFQGLPVKVADFILGLKFPEDKNIYYYGISTYGGFVGNAVKQLDRVLAEKGAELHYGDKIRMFSNYVVLYNMSKKIREITEKSNKNTIPIIENIKKKYRSKPGRENFLLKAYYNKRAISIHNSDKNFNVSDDCVSCEICKKVCPVGNIEMNIGKPAFFHRCEQCMACIQYCPVKAINYKNITQKRRRYTNPYVDSDKLIRTNKKADV